MNHYKDACKAEDFKDCDDIYKVKKIEDKRFANRFGKKLLKRVKKVLQILQLHHWNPEKNVSILSHHQ